MFCFCSAVYLKHPPPKGAKTPKRQGFRWFFLILSKNQAPYKNKSKQKNKSGGNLVIYHFGGISLLVCSKGFLFCFCSAVYLKHPPPKGAKTPKRQGFRWFFLILSKNQAPYKNKSKQKNKSGGNLVIYHFGGISLLVCSRFCFFVVYFFIFFVFSLCLFFFPFVLFFLSCFFWLFCFLCLFSLKHKKENKEKRPTTKGNNKEGKEKGRERKPPKQRRIFGKGFLFCFCSAVYL